MSLLDKIRPDKVFAAITAPRPTDKPRSPSDFAKIRMTLARGRSISGPGGAYTLSDGDEAVMSQEDAASFVHGGDAILLGFVPAPTKVERTIDGPARTIRFDLITSTPSRFLGRCPANGETLVLPAEEARRYVRAGEARFDHASARAELEAELVALARDPAEAAARRVILALDDVLRTAGVHAPFGDDDDVRR